MDQIGDPVAFFHKLGGLHDARVLWVSWGEGEFRMVVDNLHADFMDGTEPSPDFPGYSARPATVVFTGVKDVAGHVRQEAGYISDVEIASLRDCYRVSIVGTDTWMFAFDCVSVGLEPAGEPASVGAHYAQLKA
jgi:hypothetical protein